MNFGKKKEKKKRVNFGGMPGAARSQAQSWPGTAATPTAPSGAPQQGAALSLAAGLSGAGWLSFRTKFWMWTA